MPVRPNSSSTGFKLPRTRILRGSGVFDRVFRHGQKVQGQVLDTRFIIEPSAGYAVKVGFAAGKKTGNAVSRNRSKRLMREAFRTSQNEVNRTAAVNDVSVQIVFTAKKNRMMFDKAVQDINRHLTEIIRFIAGADHNETHSHFSD